MPKSKIMPKSIFYSIFFTSLFSAIARLQCYCALEKSVFLLHYYKSYCSHTIYVKEKGLQLQKIWNLNLEIWNFALRIPDYFREDEALLCEGWRDRVIWNLDIKKLSVDM